MQKMCFYLAVLQLKPDSRYSVWVRSN